MNTLPNSLLTSILSTKRCDNSIGENQFRLWLNNHIKSMEHVKNIQILPRGCIAVIIGDKPTTLFSCHVDTVHSKDESNGTNQKIVYDANTEHIMLDPSEKSSCLGADDGAGIYIMLRMIQANKKGAYIFHTGEEKGGLGAKEILAKQPDWLKQFKRAVAFDRPNDFEVIITQGGMPCASKEAGMELAEKLSEFNLTYQISERGVFTDTKVYSGVIPECFNLGVGYAFQHTPEEVLDVSHVENLIEAAISLDWESLLVVRKPTPNVYSNNWMPKPIITAPKAPEPVLSIYEELDQYTFEDLLVATHDNPEEMAKVFLRIYAELKGKTRELEVLHEMLET